MTGEKPGAVLLVTRHLSLVTAFLERETGIEPATNSLEGCDSTTELLPRPLATCHLSLVTCHLSLFLTGGQGRVRTSVGHMGRQIYSLLLLTTQPPVRTNLQGQAGAALHRTELES